MRPSNRSFRTGPAHAVVVSLATSRSRVRLRNTSIFGAGLPSPLRIILSTGLSPLASSAAGCRAATTCSCAHGGSFIGVSRPRSAGALSTSYHAAKAQKRTRSLTLENVGVLGSWELLASGDRHHIGI